MEEHDGPDEMYNAGLILAAKGDDASFEKAAELFQKASMKGHIPSKRALGLMYLDGKGVAKDLGKAYDLISDAAAALNPFAMHILGKMYEEGLGVEQNDREALYMYAFAAEMGIPESAEDAERVSARIAERRSRKLRSRPILNLEVSDVDVEAACCKAMFDQVISGEVEVIDTIKGPELVKIDDDGMEVIINECPFCGKKIKKVSKNKIY